MRTWGRVEGRQNSSCRLSLDARVIARGGEKTFSLPFSAAAAGKVVPQLGTLGSRDNVRCFLSAIFIMFPIHRL